jgi:hypothetical protein
MHAIINAIFGADGNGGIAASCIPATSEYDASNGSYLKVIRKLATQPHRED